MAVALVFGSSLPQWTILEMVQKHTEYRFAKVTSANFKVIKIFALYFFVVAFLLPTAVKYSIPGVRLDLYVEEGFLGVGLLNDPSLSLRESGVPPEKEERPVLFELPMGTLLMLRSRTCSQANTNTV